MARGVAPIDDSVDPVTAAEIQQVEKRKQGLVDIVGGSSHHKSKEKEFDALNLFVTSHPDSRKRKASAMQADPDDIASFILFRDLRGSGRTVVHRASCDRKGGCQCPKRFSADSMRTLVSKIRTRYYELGAYGPWCAVQHNGNPADSKLVEKIVEAIAVEQAQAGVSVCTARERALLPQRLEKLIKDMLLRADTELEKGKEANYVRYLQDVAWITIQYRSLNRGAELSDLRIGATAWGPNKSAILFQFSFSKVLRGGDTHAFGVPALPGDPTCPVFHFKRYVEATKVRWGWRWKTDGMFVFPSSLSKKSTRMEPVTPGAMGQRFQKHLGNLSNTMGNDPKYASERVETLHGLRAGGALAMALTGHSLRDIMLQGFWKSPDTALHYIGILREVVGPEFVRAVENDPRLRKHLAAELRVPRL